MHHLPYYIILFYLRYFLLCNSEFYLFHISELVPIVPSSACIILYIILFCSI